MTVVTPARDDAAKYARLGKRVRFTGMNAETSDFHGRLSGGLGSGA